MARIIDATATALAPTIQAPQACLGTLCLDGKVCEVGACAPDTPGAGSTARTARVFR